MKKFKIANSLWKTWELLIYLSPIALFLSYHPVISIGSSSEMNFEFSIAEIWLMLFSLVSLINLKNFFKFYSKKLLLLFSFPAYAALSLLWTPSRLRAFLTLGLLFLLIFATLNIYYYLKTRPKKLPLLKKILVLSGATFSLFCWLQCILDVLGVSRDVTGLCLGCTHLAFGFPHPNGLAIEPQFMGNLLLAPALLALYNLVFEKSKPLFKKKFAGPLFTVFLITTLFLTFSRGAIYSFLIGVAIIFLLRFPAIKYSKKKSKEVSAHKFELEFNPRAWLLVPFVLGGFLLALTAQGLFAQASPTSDTFWSGVTKSIHQLSLGKIDLRPAEVSDEPNSEGQTTERPSTVQAEVQTTEPAASAGLKEAPLSSTFSGYVEQSTAFRSQLTRDALDVWNDSVRNLIFGTGLGSAGVKMLEKDPELGISKEIVQNQYVSILLELGLVGFLLAVITVAYVLYRLKPAPLFLATFAAYLASIFFFSGLPNALHILIFLVPLISDPLVQRPRRHKQE